MEKTRKRSSALLHHSVVAIGKGAFWSSSTKGRQLYFYLYMLHSLFINLNSLMKKVSGKKIKRGLYVFDLCQNFINEDCYFDMLSIPGKSAAIYEVYTICFQTFFIWAFKIVVDFWKSNMLLLYILWDDWQISMISDWNVLLQQQLEYTLLKPDCHSWSISNLTL